MEPVVTVTIHTAIDRVLEVPGFRPGAHQRGKLLARVPAGKGVNVARILSSLGVRGIATGFVGRAEMEEYELLFADSPFYPQFLAVDGTTRANITLIDPETNEETHIRDEGFTLTESDRARLRQKVNLLAAKDRIMVFAGSVPRDVPIDYAVELVDLALARKARVVVDGPGALLHALADRPLWLVKPNRDELAEMSEADVTDDDALVRVAGEMARNVHVLIVSSGAAGGYLFIDDAVMLGQVSVEKSRIKSAVGCGDALLAGFLVGQLRGESVKDSYRYALAVATAAALQPMPGVAAREAIDEMHAHASVTPWRSGESSSA